MPSKLCNAICESIYNHPEDWAVGRYFIIRSDGLKVWTANGFMFYRTYPDKGTFGFFGKIKFARALDWLKAFHVRKVEAQRSE